MSTNAPSLPSVGFPPGLSPEIQNRIQELRRQRGGIRHYLTESEGSIRHYGAIDIETNLFAETYITRGDARRFWDMNGRPIRGETDSRIRLIGINYFAMPGGLATSVVTANFTLNSPWCFKSAPNIRINYNKDVVVMEGMYNCLIPAFNLRKRLPFSRSDLAGHWLENVQLLAVHTSSIPRTVDRTIAALPMLLHLYLLVHRDPQCVYGAPRTWPDFSPSLLEQRKFLPFHHFAALHPRNPSVRCDCEVDAYRSHEMERILRRALLHFDKSYVKITIVADPY
ncbi:hypothetical protein F5Y03DRAFT_62933 [Xylaria venustula]|nr:hypothetical protein F5Y03DRAFT_62933 [Xylaria venustula]